MELTTAEIWAALSGFKKNHYKPDLHSGMFYTRDNGALFVDYERGVGFSITADTWSLYAYELGPAVHKLVELGVIAIEV